MAANGGGAMVGGRFQLIELVGQGGMGRVWRGHDTLLDRDIAVKEVLLPAELSEAERAEVVSRATWEARSAARLNHPGVITVHDVVEHDGTPWIVMEYVPGASLAAEITKNGRLPWPRVAEIGAKIADALAHTHAAGIVHRDLKPENILLAGERVVVTDFGIARMMDETTRLTKAGTMMGTLQYMAPEQFEDRPVGAAADMWSLGATLYNAIEGKPPFEGRTQTVISGVLFREPPPPVHAGPLAGPITQLLSKEPARRLTAKAAAEALTRERLAAVGHLPRTKDDYPGTITIPPRGGRKDPPPVPASRKRSPLLVFGAVAAAAVLGGGAYLAVSSGSGSAAIGDTCLVGTWQDGVSDTWTTWNGTKVAMRGGEGNIDHIFATGTDNDSFGAAVAPLYGTYQGTTLEEIERGQNVWTIHATPSNHSVSVTEDGWSVGSTNTFFYDGNRYAGYFGPAGSTARYTYQCTAGSLELITGNRVVDTETRLSTTP